MKSNSLPAQVNLAVLRIGASPLRDSALFLALTFALSWLIWIPGALLLANGMSGVGNFMLAIGSFVPLAVGFYLNLWTRQTTFRWSRWFRTLTLRRVIVAVVLPILILLPIILLRLYWGTFSLTRFAGDLSGAPYLFVGLLVIAFGEEVGWRGFLLPRLQSLNLIVVNFIIAFAWFAWQLPVLLATPSNVFGGDVSQFLAAYLLYSLFITPFFNRLALRADLNVLLPTLLRACLKTAFAVYALQGGLDLLTHPYGVGGLVWLAALNALLFGQLWLGKNPEESELERVMPLEPAIK
jgi:CAAX protease family protein